MRRQISQGQGKAKGRMRQGAKKPGGKRQGANESGANWQRGEKARHHQILATGKKQIADLWTSQRVMLVYYFNLGRI